VPVAAAAIPVVETAGGILLAVGAETRCAATVLAAVLACFAGAMAVNLRRGRLIECGCGATPTAPVTWTRVAHNLALLCGAVVVSFGQARAVSGFTPARFWLSVLTVASIATAMTLTRYGARILRRVQRDDIAVAGDCPLTSNIPLCQLTLLDCNAVYLRGSRCRR